MKSYLLSHATDGASGLYTESVSIDAFRKGSSLILTAGVLRYRDARRYKQLNLFLFNTMLKITMSNSGSSTELGNKKTRTKLFLLKIIPPVTL